MRARFKGFWARLRREHFAKPGNLLCALCADTRPITKNFPAQEVYAYPTPASVRLMDVVIMCYRCHDAIRYERTRAGCQKPYADEIAEHYCLVNGGLSGKIRCWISWAGRMAGGIVRRSRDIFKPARSSAHGKNFAN